MKRLTGKCILAGVWILAICVCGCGYNQSGSNKNKLDTGYRWSTLYREDIQTVAVPIFTNKSYHRGVEFGLTEAVVKHLEFHAPYKVVPKERADTILEGEITAVNVATLSRDWITSMPKEQQVTLTVDLIWKDLRNGRILLQRKGLTQSEVYYPTLGEDLFIGSQGAIERFALQIVQEMQADW